MSTPIIIGPPPPPPPPPQKLAAGQTEWEYLWGEAWRQAQLSCTHMYAVKRWWKSKTLWLGSSLTALGAAAKVAAVWAFAEKDLVVSAFGAYGPAVFLGFGVAVVALRLVTKGGLTK